MWFPPPQAPFPRCYLYDAEENPDPLVNKYWLSSVNRVVRLLRVKTRGHVMLNIETKKLGTVALVNLQGRMVIGNTETLRQAVQSLTQVSAVKLDLSRVSLIDAHGLGVLLQLREQTLAKGARFQLTNASVALREIMRLTRLDTVFQMSSGVEVAATAQQVQLAA
jgi:anti-anti-sigma factor